MIDRPSLLLAALILVIATGADDPRSVVLEVEAGRHDRGNTPIIFPAPATIGEQRDLSLERLDNKQAVPVQAATIGVPHEVKGEAIVCFAVLKPGRAASEPLRAELGDLVARQMGKALKPERVLFARELPKTRSAKIMRRVVRATYLGRDPGDLSSLDNPGGVKAIADAS